MFLLNSRLASFVVRAYRMVHPRTSPKGYVQLSLPSSLRIVLPIAFVYSTRPPVSVYGTVKSYLLYEDFLENRKSSSLEIATCILDPTPTCKQIDVGLLKRIYLPQLAHCFYPAMPGKSFPTLSPLNGSDVVLRLIENLSDTTQYRNFNLLSIGYAF